MLWQTNRVVLKNIFISRGNMMEKTAKSRKYRLLLIFVLILLPLVSLPIIFIPRAGHFLVSQDALQKSDIIVVLMGSIPDRILEAADLYHQGYAKEIIMVETYMVGHTALVKRGVIVPDQAKLSKLAAVELGVPEKKITIIAGESRSTRDEARYIKDYLQKHLEINTVTLVTSKYHSTRARKIFVQALGSLEHDITLISHPSKYDTFNPDAWWQDREDAISVLLEYLKLIDFYFN